MVGGDGEGGGGERFGDGVDAVEGAGEDEQVVDGDGVEVGGEGAVVDEAAGFVDDDEGVDHPGGEVREDGDVGMALYIFLVAFSWDRSTQG